MNHKPVEEAQKFINSFGLGATFISIIVILFGKKFIEKYAEKTVEKAFNETLTRESEVIKQVFRKDLDDFRKNIQLDIAKEVEPLKASLSRDNIAFQIVNTEFNKLKFSRLDNLYLKLNELKTFSQSNFSSYQGADDIEKRRQAFFTKYQETENALQQAMLYIGDDITASAITMLNACHSAFSIFNQMTNAELMQVNYGKNEELSQRFATISSQAFEKLIEALGNLPQVLRDIEDEFKKHIVLSGISKD